LAKQFRQAGIPCEVFLNPEQAAKQFMLAPKKGLRWMVIAGENPLQDPLTLRDLSSRQNHEGLAFEEIVKKVKENT
jgi:histidyl-tRNA synthetase